MGKNFGRGAKEEGEIKKNIGAAEELNLVLCLRNILPYKAELAYQSKNAPASFSVSP